jgi:hypothetical protein
VRIQAFHNPQVGQDFGRCVIPKQRDCQHAAALEIRKSIRPPE